MRADQLVVLGVLVGAMSARRAADLAGRRRTTRRLLNPGRPTAQYRMSNRQRLLAMALFGSVAGQRLFGWLGIGLGMAGALALDHALRRAVGARETARIERELPLAVETVARVLRSGTSPLLAIAEAAAALPGPVGTDLHVLAMDAERFGLRAAAHAWGTRRPAAALAARALVVALDAGRGAAEGLDAVAISLRERGTIAREVRALAAQARLSAAVMACTPVGFAMLLCGSDPTARDFLMHSAPGLGCLSVGLTLDLVGYRWMRSIAQVVL